MGLPNRFGFRFIKPHLESLFLPGHPLKIAGLVESISQRRYEIVLHPNKTLKLGQ
jgi:hypothetical protein